MPTTAFQTLRRPCSLIFAVTNAKKTIEICLKAASPVYLTASKCVSSALTALKRCKSVSSRAGRYVLRTYALRSCPQGL